MKVVVGMVVRNFIFFVTFDFHNFLRESRKMESRIFFMLFLLITSNSIAQIPVFGDPKPAGLGTYWYSGIPTQSNPTPTSANRSFSPTNTEENNRRIMLEVEEHQRQEAIRKLRLQQEAAAEMGLKRPSTTNKLPSKADLPGAEFYESAFNELEDMAEGRKPLELKKAIFAVENAFFGNSLSYDTYLAFLSQILEVCNGQLRNKQNPSNLDKLMAIYSYFADTVSVKMPGTEEILVHYPVTYDFEDFYGREDHTKMFVTKLMQSNSGQCHSMPLLFLVLAQEMGAEAYMAYAPEHSYVKFKDEKGNWHNIELTMNRFTTDAFLLESGYIKAEAIRSRIFLDTVSTKRLLSESFFDLGRSYSRKYGVDEFVEMCANRALQVNPDDIFAWQLKSDYQTTLTDYVLRQRQIRNEEQLTNDSIASAHVQKTISIYQEIDRRGFETMPEEVYFRWLKSAEQEKNRQTHENQLQIISNQIKSR